MPTEPTGCALLPRSPPRKPSPDACACTAREQVDLYNRLYRERIVFLGQQISDDIANQIIGVMLYLDSEVRSSHPPRCVCLVALRAEACAC